MDIGAMAAILGGMAIVAFCVSLGGAWVMRRTAPRMGLVDHPGARKIHQAPTPLGGGVAMFLGLWLPLWAGVAAALLLRSRGGPLPEWLAELLESIPGHLPSLAVIFGATLLIAFVGLLDDRFRIPSLLRLGIIAAAAAGLALLRIERVTLFIESEWLAFFMTVAWITGITIAFMVLDNMDGLCTGVALIACVILAIIALQTGQALLAAMLALLAGALGGFLVFNFPPASIFMGDCGSAFIGFTVAILAADFTFYNRGNLPAQAYYPFMAPLLILATPLFDIATVTMIRLREGRSPFEADKRHFSHRLVELGMSQRQTILTIYLVTAAIGLGATILYQVTLAGAIVTMAQAGAVFAIIVLLERAGRAKEARNRDLPP